MTDYSKYPCGADGLSFPNGLPEEDQLVEARTVWSNGKFERMIFKEEYGYLRRYSWFKVYAKPRVEDGSMPIVLEWRPIIYDDAVSSDKTHIQAQMDIATNKARKEN